MEPWTAEQKALAKSLFGRPVRVLVAAWILDRCGEPFFQQEACLAIAATHGESLSAAAQELERFSSLGLLKRLEPGGSERKVWYHVNKEHLAWPLLEEAAYCFGLLPRPDDG